MTSLPRRAWPPTSESPSQPRRQGGAGAVHFRRGVDGADAGGCRGDRGRGALADADGVARGAGGAARVTLTPARGSSAGSPRAAARRGPARSTCPRRRG
jgi:hypothetical protein